MAQTHRVFDALNRAFATLSRQGHSRTPITNHVRTLQPATPQLTLTKQHVKQLQKTPLTFKHAVGTYYVIHGKSAEDPTHALQTAKTELANAHALFHAIVDAYTPDELRAQIPNADKILAEHPGAKRIHFATAIAFVPASEEKTSHRVAASFKQWELATKPRRHARHVARAFI